MNLAELSARFIVIGRQHHFGRTCYLAPDGLQPLRECSLEALSSFTFRFTVKVKIKHACGKSPGITVGTERLTLSVVCL